MALGAVAIKVRPKTAEVYVDGRYVGAAGSYDGFPGYLWIDAGAHRTLGGFRAVSVGRSLTLQRMLRRRGRRVRLASSAER